MTERCLSFYYFLHDFARNTSADTQPSISVYISTNNHQEAIPAWRASGGNYMMWEYATVSIRLKEPYQYSFVASQSTAKGLFLLDNISVYEGPCPAKLTCSFTNGSFCDWISPSQDGPPGFPSFFWMVEDPYTKSRTLLPGTISSQGSARAEGRLDCELDWKRLRTNAYLLFPCFTLHSPKLNKGIWSLILNNSSFPAVKTVEAVARLKGWVNERCSTGQLPFARKIIWSPFWNFLSWQKTQLHFEHRSDSTTTCTALCKFRFYPLRLVIHWIRLQFSYTHLWVQWHTSKG